MKKQEHQHMQVLNMCSTHTHVLLQWADLAGAHFEGALLSSSDVERICQNPVSTASC